MRRLGIKVLLLVLFCAVFTGCVSLKPIAEFSTTSAEAIKIINKDRPHWTDAVIVPVNIGNLYPEADSASRKAGIDVNSYVNAQDKPIDDLANVLVSYLEAIAAIADEKTAIQTKESIIANLRLESYSLDLINKKLGENERISELTVLALNKAVMMALTAHRKSVLIKAMERGNASFIKLLEKYQILLRATNDGITPNLIVIKDRLVLDQRELVETQSSLPTNNELYLYYQSKLLQNDLSVIQQKIQLYEKWNQYYRDAIDYILDGFRIINKDYTTDPKYVDAYLMGLSTKKIKQVVNF